MILPPKIPLSPEPARFSSHFSVILATKIFIVFICLALIAIDHWRSWNAHANRLREAEIATSNLASSLAQHAEDAFIEADTVLVSLVERLEVEGTDQRHLLRLNSLLKKHAAELSQIHGLFVYDENGQWLVNSRQVLPDKVNNSDREYFSFHRSHTDLGPHIGPPVHSRSTGEWILTLSRRFNHADGSFGGVVLATIYMDYFNKHYNTFDVGNQGAVILTLDNGILLVRHPFVEKWIGQSMRDAPLFDYYLPQAPVGNYMGNKSVIDDIVRLTSYRHLARYPMVVAISLSKEEILSGWWTNTWQNLLVVAMLAILLALMGFRLTHHIELHLKAEKNLLKAQGKLQDINLHLEKIAMQDSLTGLANRRRFDFTLINEFNRAMRQKSSLALLMIDVDWFKQFNDMYGHPAGDECLRRISKVIQDCQKRTNDVIARYGGEEITVLLPDTDSDGAFAAAERIRVSIFNLGIEHRGSAEGVITISCGVASLIPDRNDTDPMKLVVTADRALYAAKMNGRNIVCCESDTATA